MAKGGSGRGERGVGGGSEPWEGAVQCWAGNVLVAMPTPETRPAGDSALREFVTMSPRSYGTRGGEAGGVGGGNVPRFSAVPTEAP